MSGVTRSPTAHSKKVRRRARLKRALRSRPLVRYVTLVILAGLLAKKLPPEALLILQQLQKDLLQ